MFLFISLTLFLAACGDEASDTSEEREEPQEEQQETETNEEEEAEEPEKVELSREDEIKAFIAEKVEADYNSTSIRDIRVNEDAGTGEGYIVLVDLSFDAKNRPGTAKDMIDMYSSDLAATLAEQEDINEVVSFWEVPYLQESGNIVKIATERSGEGMAFTEQWYDPNIFE